MPLTTVLGLVLALALLSGLLIHARSERPGISNRTSPRSRPWEGMAWVLVFDPVVIFIGFCSYMGGQELMQSGLSGVAAWGVLWPLVVEAASGGHPYRMARLLRLYSEYRLTLPFTAEHQVYRRKMGPLRPTEWKLFALVLPVVLAGVMLASLFSGAAFT